MANGYDPKFGKYIDSQKAAGASKDFIKDLEQIDSLMRKNDMSTKQFVANFQKLKSTSKSVKDDMAAIGKDYDYAKNKLREQGKVWDQLILPKYAQFIKATKTSKKEMMKLLATIQETADIEESLVAIEQMRAKALQSGNKELDKLLQGTQDLLKVEQARLRKEKEINKETEKAFGILTGNLKKIPLIGGRLADMFGEVGDKYLPKFGKQLSENLSLAAAERGAISFGEQLKIVGQTARSVFGSSGIMLLGLAAAAAAFVGLIALATKFSKALGEQAKQFNMSTKAAKEFRSNLAGGELSIKKSADAALALGNYMGNVNQFAGADGSIPKGFEKMIEQTAMIAYNFGLSNEEAAKLSVYAKSAGTDANGLAIEINNQVAAAQALGMQNVSFRGTQKDIAKLSKQQLSTFGKNRKELIKASMAAQSLGIELNKALDAGKASLDIEAALGNEMQARAVFNKQFNFEAIRQATILGDTDGLLKAQADVIAAAGDDLEKSVYHQESIAKALNMQVDDVLKMKKNMDMAKQLGVNLDMFNKMSGKELEILAAQKGINAETIKEVIEQRKNVDLAARQEELMARMSDALRPFKDMIIFIGEKFAGFLEILGPKGTLLVGLGLAIIIFRKVRRTIFQMMTYAKQMSAAMTQAAIASSQIRMSGGMPMGGPGMPMGGPMGGPMYYGPGGAPAGGGKTPKSTKRGTNRRATNRRRPNRRGGRFGGGALLTTMFMAPMVMDMISNNESETGISNEDMALETAGMGGSIVQYNKLMASPDKAASGGGGGIMKKIMGSLKSLGSTATDLFKGSGDKTKAGKGGFLSNFADKVKNFASSAKSYVTGGLTKAKDFLGSKVKGFFSGMGSKIGDWFKGTGTKIKDFAVSSAGKVKNVFNTTMDYLSNPAKLLKDAKATIKKAGSGALKGIMKFGPISALVEGIFTHLEIKDLISQGMDRGSLEQEVGKTVSGSLGGVIGGAGAAGIVQALNLVPGLGVLATPLAYMLGDAAGRWLGETIAEAVGAKPVGKVVLDTFYGDTVKKAYATQPEGETIDATDGTANIKVNDFSLETNRNDKIGGVLDNKSVQRMVTALEALVNQQTVAVVTPDAVDKLATAVNARNSFRK